MNEEKLKNLLRVDLLALKILRFFTQNPSSIDSVGGITAWVNSDRSEVEKSLDKLSAIGALEADSSGAMRGFSLPDNEEEIKTIKDIVENA